MMKQKLSDDKELLIKQLFWIQTSYDECSHIGLKAEYSVDEFENQGTLVDVVNNAHKRGLFEDIDELRIMKDVRNTIAHEYIEDELVDVFDEVLQYTKKLILIIKKTVIYIDNIIGRS